MSSILALDLGTRTGYAFGRMKGDGDVKSGTLDWASAKEVKEWKRSRATRRGDPRVLRFYSWLTTNIEVGVRRIVFEDVEFCSQTYQCQLWTSFRTCVWIAVEGRGIQIDAVPVGTLKKFATGNGSATKSGMAHALARAFPDLYTIHNSQKGEVEALPSGRILDDNAVDALWLYHWARLNCV